MFQDTTSLERIEAMKARINIIQGGARAGKTIATLIMLCDLSFDVKDKIISVTTDSYPNLERGAMRDWQKLLKSTNRTGYFEINRTKHTWRNIVTNTVVEFFSCDSADALGAARDYLFVNEANRIDYDTFSNLELRTTERIWLDFNPVAEFYAHTELLKKRTDCEFIKLTYKDNEAIPENVLKALLQRKGDGTSNFWRVYGLGEIGSLEGNIYQGWTMLDEVPDGFILKRYGLDFGFSNDETAMTAIYENEAGELFIDEIIYETGLLPSAYVERLEKSEIKPDVLIVADSARPEIIAEIKAGGFMIAPANKDKGSVLRGIERVQERKVFYRGKNLEREFLTYAWKKNKAGKSLGVPQDGNDHCFVADTIIKTPFGDKKMIDLVKQGKGWVYSEGGKIRYFRNAEYKGHRETVILEFENGAKIQCTPDHPIYTINRGIVPAYLLNTQDMIQLVMYEGKDNITNQARVQRLKLLERLKGTLLPKRSTQATHPAQGSLDISQRADTEGNGDRPYRQKYRQQPDRKSEAHDTLGEQQKRSTRNHTETQREHGNGDGKSQAVAQERGRQEMALGAWQESVSKERADRKKLCSLWEKILYNTILKKGALLLWKLQNESKTTQTKWATREYTTLKSRAKASVEATYCLDVYDTSNLVVNGDIVVSNCMDSLRYAVDDMSKPKIDWGGGVILG